MTMNYITLCFIIPSASFSSAPAHQKVEVTPAVAVGNPGKGSRANEMATPALTAQVGGACSIVHVLELKEGMAILPSSNLKVKLY